MEFLSSRNMFTSFFDNIDRIRYPVSISRFSPSWYEGPKYLDAAPSESLLNWYHNEKKSGANEYNLQKEYERKYINETLSQLSPEKVWNDICSLYPEADSREITLLCYEAPEKFCHRHLLANWLKKHGYQIKEKM